MNYFCNSFLQNSDPKITFKLNVSFKYVPAICHLFTDLMWHIEYLSPILSEDLLCIGYYKESQNRSSSMSITSF